MINKILVATDGSEHAQKALELSCDIAHMYGAGLIVVHAMTDDPIPPELLKVAEVEHITDPPAPDLSVPRAPAPVVHGEKLVQRQQQNRKVHEYVGNKVLKTAETFAKSKRIDGVKSILEDGDPAERILARAEQDRPDMIILGSRGFSNIKALVLGSVSNKVTHRAKCTCVTVK